MRTQQKADAMRRQAKVLFGESIGRNGYLNDDLPMSRFVDAVIAAAVLEIAALQLQAMKETPKENS